MKIAVIADTHIPERTKALPKELIERLRGVDMIIHAGDLVEMSVIEQLRTVTPNVRAVWGNMDPLGVRAYLSEKLILQAGKFRIGVMHGFGDPHGLLPRLQQAFKDDKVDVVVFGHSHTPTQEKIGDTLFFNPGSVTDDIFASYKSYGIIEVSDVIVTKIVKL